MKKMIAFLMVLMALFGISVCAYAGTQPHPDSFSGEVSAYEGKWIINGKTEEDTNWTLEITADGKYRLHNEYQEFEGDITFTPGKKDTDIPDMLKLDFNPDLNIEIVLMNEAGALIDTSGQGLIFVKPGNKAEIEEAELLENYPREKMVGDWVLDHIAVHAAGFDFKFTNEDIMPYSYTGDTRLILGFEDGIVYNVSEVLETRIPISRYKGSGIYIYFENPNKVPCCYQFTGFIFNDKPGDFSSSGGLTLDVTPMPEGAPADMYLMMHFERITRAPEAPQEGD